jgi:8-hydroxy-5-deazaflavin:NADPH oxidoreductase
MQNFTHDLWPLHHLAAAAHKTPRSVLFYASDDNTANNDVEALIKDSGFEPVSIGGINQSIRMEVFGALHEFGALGKNRNAVRN